MAGAVNGGLFAAVSPLTPGVVPEPFRVYSVDDKLALRLISPRVLRYSSVSIIPTKLPSRLQPNGT